MIIERIKERAKNNLKRIALPESNDIRVLEAASITKKEGFAIPVLIGNSDEIYDICKNNDIDIDGVEIINPVDFKDLDILIEDFYNLRKEKGISLEDATNIISNNYVYFGNMLVRNGYCDGLVSGRVHSSSDTLRPALQIIKTKSDVKLASAYFLMEFEDPSIGYNGAYVFSDCGMNQNPTSEELVYIAKESYETFCNVLESDDCKMAFLSHSTNGSSKCDDSKKVVDAVNKFKELYPDINADGEMQFDTAIIPEVAKDKMPYSKVAGYANTFIFPDLDAGNIAYKVTERLAHAKAYGPLTQGLRKPVNDLSRGSSVDDIVGVIAITAVQK